MVSDNQHGANARPGTPSAPEVAVVIPLFWSAATIEVLVDRIVAALDSHSLSHEIVLVDDGSGDDTWARVVGLSQRYPQVRALRFTRNFGQQAAMGMGLEASTASWVVTIDADLQDDPDYIPTMLEIAKGGYDVVLAQWADAVGSRGVRWSSAMFYRVFNQLTGVRLPRRTGTYRVMSRRVVDHFLSLSDRTEFFSGMIAWFGFPATTFNVQRHEREHGRSSYSLRRRFSLASSALVSFSTIPLKIAAWVGLLVCFFAILLGVLVIILRFVGVIVEAGFAGIMVTLLFMSGTILLSTGILGFYLGSLIRTAGHRPASVVAERVGFDAGSG